MQLGRAGRLYAPHNRPTARRGEPGHDAGNQAAAAHGYDDGLDLGQLFDDFERDGRLARDDVGMVERRHDRELLLAGDLLRLDAPIFGRAAGEDDLAAPLLDACDFYSGRRFGHDDHRAHAELLGGVRDSLAVITRRKRDHPAPARGIGKFPDGVVGAADLERADRLFVLELEMRTQFFDVEELRAARDSPQAVCGFVDVSGSDHATSSASPWVSIWAQATSRLRPHRWLLLHLP